MHYATIIISTIYYYYAIVIIITTTTILVKSPWDTKREPLTQLPVSSY